MTNPLDTSVNYNETLNCEHRIYLWKTDWYVIRYLEVGTAIPGDITTARAAARVACTGSCD